MGWQTVAMKKQSRRPQVRPRKLYLAERRKAAGLRQIDIAQKLKKDVNTIASWERGEILLGEITLAEYAESVGCEPDELYYPPDVPNANALLRDQPKDVQDQAINVLRALIKPNK